MTLILAILVTFLLPIALVFGLFVYRLSNSISLLEEQVEESLDIIDGCYTRITEISNHPVVSDDPVVKQLLGEIRDCKDSLLLIANKITAFSTGDVDGKEED